MMNLQRILLATDFSDCAAPARDVALELCTRFQATLYLLHVIHELPVEVPESGMEMAFPGFLENIGTQRQELRRKAAQELNAAIADAWREQHEIVEDSRFGKPAAEIVEYARDNEVDLIVIGSHGRSGLERVLLGSVAESVVRKAPCPVLTIRPPQTAAEESRDQDRFPGIHPLPVGP